jgi:light-regulated signal transduction histidine kinase (bacteriophytochrome)
MNYIQEIEQHNRRLKEIAWTQAHLVRAPLARIMGIADLLKSGGNDLDTSNRLLDFLETSAVELDQIIKAIIRKSQQV